MPDRIQLRRIKGWRKPEGAVVVTRATIWGNPWQIGSPGTLRVPRRDACGWTSRYRLRHDLDAATAVEQFRFLLDGTRDVITPDIPRGRLAIRLELHARRRQILVRLSELRGRDLCCTCAPDAPCHADVLMEIAND